MLEAAGTVLTNKYAEGYPGRRYYGGCEFVDEVETLAISRAKSLFGAAYANVQPHSGAQANAAVLGAIATPGDRILGLALDQGGHLTHGMKLNFSGKLYESHFYGVDPTTFLVDMDQVRERALEGEAAGAHRRPGPPTRGSLTSPRSARSPTRWARRSGSIWRTSRDWWLRACTRHRCRTLTSPHPPCTRRSAARASGFILTNDLEMQKKLNSNVFPGQQGGPLMHIIAAKATAFKLAAEPEFKDRQERTVRGARILAERLTASDAKAANIDVLTGGTDVHLVLVDLRNSAIHGQDAEDILHSVGITVNRNAVPNDPRPPMTPSGVRIGTPALATRGFGDTEFTEVADIIANALKPSPDVEALRARVGKLAQDFPLDPKDSPRPGRGSDRCQRSTARSSRRS